METDFELILAEYGGRQKVFQRGDVIYSSESGVEGIYYLKSGKIRIDNSRVKSKKEVLVWLLSSGSFFGISSYYNGYNSCAYITTVVSEKAEVILISREEFIHLLKANKEVRNYIINLLYRRLDYIEKRKLYSSRISLKKKVSDSLIFLSPAHCPPESALEGKPYKILIALSELATMINAPRKELVLLIDDLINKKILERDGEGITVRNVEKLMLLE